MYDLFIVHSVMAKKNVHACEYIYIIPVYIINKDPAG